MAPPVSRVAFGVRQLAGAFARRSVESQAAWLALVEKSGDKSPHSKRCRVGETACRMPVARVRRALNTYGRRPAQPRLVEAPLQERAARGAEVRVELSGNSI